MPVIYRCGSCGKTLFVFRSVGQDSFGVPTPDELFSKIGSRCPGCGKALSKPRLDRVKVMGRA
jgi:DNA-directed RNA polymerase subunit RPC12/RpoP